MTAQIENPLRLQQRAPAYDKSEGDSIAHGFDRAMNRARELADASGRRVMVTCARYSRGAFRVQTQR